MSEVNCDHENVKTEKWHEEGYEVEQIKTCKDCGKTIYHNSYGHDLLMGGDND